MKPLFSEIELKLAKSSDKLPCKCYQCDKKFYVKKKYITHFNKLKDNSYNKNKFCSNKCYGLFYDKKVELNCSNCGVKFKKIESQIKRSKSGNHFCSKSCAATYNNKHKKLTYQMIESEIETSRAGRVLVVPELVLA